MEANLDTHPAPLSSQPAAEPSALPPPVPAQPEPVSSPLGAHSRQSSLQSSPSMRGRYVRRSCCLHKRPLADARGCNADMHEAQAWTKRPAGIAARPAWTQPLQLRSPTLPPWPLVSSSGCNAWAGLEQDLSFLLQNLWLRQRRSSAWRLEKSCSCWERWMAGCRCVRLHVCMQTRSCAEPGCDRAGAASRRSISERPHTVVLHLCLTCCCAALQAGLAPWRSLKTIQTSAMSVCQPWNVARLCPSSMHTGDGIVHRA